MANNLAKKRSNGTIKGMQFTQQWSTLNRKQVVKDGIFLPERMCILIKVNGVFLPERMCTVILLTERIHKSKTVQIAKSSFSWMENLFFTNSTRKREGLHAKIHG